MTHETAWLGARNQAAATFGGSIYVAHGLVALTYATLFNNSTNLALDPFLRIWAATLLSLVFGFLLLATALLVGSETDFRRIVGGGMGVIVTIVGAVNALVLLTTTVGIIGTSPEIPQVAAAGELLFLLTIVLLVVGFPLGMVGSFQVMNEPKGPEV